MNSMFRQVWSSICKLLEAFHPWTSHALSLLRGDRDLGSDVSNVQSWSDKSAHAHHEWWVA
eukprot:2419993-Prorocentrum_lima.AAC.1